MSTGKKIIRLSENLDIIDGDRAYYVYFERPGHRFSRIDEIVSSEQRGQFLTFLRNAACGEIRVFRFRSSSGEFRENAVSVSSIQKNGSKILEVTLTDIGELFSYVGVFEGELSRIRAAFSVTSECLFSYEKKTNVFRLIRYTSGQCSTIFEEDIDSWREEMLKTGIVNEENSRDFEKFIVDTKSLPQKLYATLIGSFRSGGKFQESLDFLGVKIELQGESSLVGRVVLSSRMKKSVESQELLNELRLDPLTHTLNKKSILEHAERRFKEARQNGNCVALVIVDLDHFKPVNDAFGHLAGDKVLEETGEILLKICDGKGTVGRYGGDEFLLILDDVNGEVDLRGTLQAVLENIKNAFNGMFEGIFVTASVGASCFPNDGDTFDELFKKADFCLYRAKDKGRNRYVFFRDDLHKKLYLKSVESSSGVKYQGREVQELKYMAEFMQNLAITPYNSIKSVCEHFIEIYNLSDVSLYYGENLRRVYCVGEKKAEMQEASYARSDEFKKLLDGKRIVRMDFPEDVKNFPNFSLEMKKRDVRSTVQCIIGTEESITGIITFDRIGKSAQWAEYEVNCCMMFASCFNLLPEQTKVDFALYSKLEHNN